MRSRALRPFLIVLVATIALATFSESASADPYTVVKGDTLEKIAKRTGTTVADLVARNKLRDPNHLGIGAVLDVPAPPPATPALPKPILYTVKSGDTALRLAKRFSVTVKDLSAVNQLKNANSIRIGLVLLMPTPALPAGVTVKYPLELLNHPERLALLPAFDAAAKEFGVPPDLLKSTAWIESSWVDNALSSTGAIGIGQLLPETAVWLANEMMGEPKLDPLKAVDNIRMSARFIRWLLDKTGGNETLAMQGYYQGLRSVQDNGASPVAVAYAKLVHGARPRFVAPK
ncbi:MAG: LysM peptidoglycan-binding domain-containing protein [Acidimicrobiales bacterium]